MKKTASLTVLLLALSASACTQRNLTYAPPPQNRVFAQTLSHNVEFNAKSSALSGEERAVMARVFAGVDMRSVNKADISATREAQAHAVKEALADMGVPPSAMHIKVGSDANPLSLTDPISHDNSAAKDYMRTVKVDLTYYRVLPPQCNYWGVDARESNMWTSKSSAGCATNSNLGQMVADPRDLIRGRQGSGPDAQAAASAVTRYHENAASGGGSSATSAAGSTGGE